ncbi:cytochrome c [Reichenbachiella sp. MALMAid0571]|uniref:c-type cytochrome n=1 Tax=Reichenbachiella sp. MALMAid0571 TaxID=3143939 RepID=UPI0032DE59DB
MKKMYSVYVSFTKPLLFLSFLLVMSCSGDKKASTTETPSQQEEPKEAPKQETTDPDPLKNKGIGPVKEVSLGEIDDAIATEGKALFEQLCTACHKPTEKLLGPAPKGILERRSPEWVMNMIINPDVMIQKDPIAKQLLVEANGIPMANQNVSQEDARKILEYFRTL